MSQVDPADAQSFGADPQRYDRARPGYPDAMVQAVVAASPGPDIIDVGLGTGIAARQFRAAGCWVLGVEPDARMAAWARRRGLEVEVADFESWDSAGRQFDAVISGEAWHWVDPVAGAAKAARILRPGGRLAAFWNVGQPESEVVEVFAAVYRDVLPGSRALQRWTPGTDRYAVAVTRAADGIREASAFTEPEQWRFTWERFYNREDWLDELPTAGGHTRLPPGKLSEVLACVGDAIDTLGGGFRMYYTATVITAVNRLSG